MWGRVGDVINHAQFHLNRFRGFGPSGGRISQSPIDHVTRKIVSEITYNVLSGTLNFTIPYHQAKISSRYKLVTLV